MASRRLTILFLVPACTAIFFGGGGCGCGSCGCQQPAPSPPPPSCTCAAPPPPPRPCLTPPSNYAVAPPPPPPAQLPVPIGSPQNSYASPVQSSYVAAAPVQKKVPASSYSVEPVPIEKPAPPKYDDAYHTNSETGKTSSLIFKSKADAEDYEILASSGYRRKPQKKRTSSKDPKCNNEQLRRILHKSIDQALSRTQAKLSISSAAKEMFGYNFDVICAEKAFVFSVNSELYCELSIGNTFCLVFKH